MIAWLSLALGAPADVPVRVAPRPDLGAGAVRVRIADVEVDALGAAVVSLAQGRPVPDGLRASGVPLGRSERTWRVPCAPGEDALQTAERWAAHPDVRSTSPDLVLHHVPFVQTNDPEVGAQWYLELLDFDPLFELSRGDPAVRVAVIDGPIDVQHPDLVDGVLAPYDALEDDADPSPDCGPDGDCETHGTSSAGIIAARSDNGVDIVGLCSACTLVPIRLLGGATTVAHDVAAFEHAIAQDVAVINNSWGFVEAIPAPEPLADVIDRAQTEPRGGLGALVVFAAGNDDRRLYPNEVTGLPGVITVSATDRYGFPTNYTNSGPTIDVSAPSATVTLQAGGGLNTTFGGTSAAAPVVSGIAAWAFSVRPDLSARELGELLVDTARPVNEEGSRDEQFGWGHLDPIALMAALQGEGLDTDAEEPRACGCAAPGGGVGGVALAVGLLGVTRRRRGPARAR